MTKRNYHTAPLQMETIKAVDYKNRANPNLYKFTLPQNMSVDRPKEATKAKRKARITLADPFAKREGSQ